MASQTQPRCGTDTKAEASNERVAAERSEQRLQCLVTLYTTAEERPLLRDP